MILKGKNLWAFVFLFFVLSAVPTTILWIEVRGILKTEKHLVKKQNIDARTLSDISSSLNQVIFSLGKSQVVLPPKLASVICAEQAGIVKSVKTVEIDPIFAPYNPSIIEKEGGGYHLVFRYDQPKTSWSLYPFHTHIGYAELDNNFFPVHVKEKIHTQSLFSEDPRIVKVGDKYFLSWNDLVDKKTGYRAIHVGRWDPKSRKLDYITNLDQQIKPVEKNWMPFERQSKEGPHLSFIYGIHPHKVIDLPKPSVNQISHFIYPGKINLITMDWNQQWGTPCGGTPARLINNEYITFFHSWFKNDNKIWYVMGAYTFEAEPPYAITSITPYPILFKGIYSSEYLNTADVNKYCIFPAGLAIEKTSSKTLLHVSCGENDSHIKIVTFDYEKLKKSMTPVK